VCSFPEEELEASSHCSTNAGLAVRASCADFSLANYSSTRVYTKISGEPMRLQLKVASIWR